MSSTLARLKQECHH